MRAAAMAHPILSLPPAAWVGLAPRRMPQGRQTRNARDSRCCRCTDARRYELHLASAVTYYVRASNIPAPSSQHSAEIIRIIWCEQ
jgi:hypothetical protein